MLADGHLLTQLITVFKIKRCFGNFVSLLTWIRILILIRIRIDQNFVDPDPDTINPDPHHWHFPFVTSFTYPRSTSGT